MKPKSRTAAPPFDRWRGLPTELPDALYSVSFYARATAVELYRSGTARTEEYSGRIDVIGDWMDWVLGRVLAVNGKQRNNIKRHLQELKEAGIVQVGDGFITVCIGQPLAGTQPEASASTSPGAREDFATTSPLPRPDLAIESSNCNHDVHVPQNRTRTEREQKQSESARARPDLVGFNWYCSTLELLPTSAPAPGSWREQYAFMGSQADAERAKVASELRADPWCMTNKHLVTPEHVRKHWQKYVGGEAKPVLKPLVATPREQLEKARERLQDAAKTLRIIEGLPWFDKEKPTYPERLAKATADVSRLRGELAQLEGGFTRAAAS